MIKKTFFTFSLVLFCLCLNAQDAVLNSKIDSLKKLFVNAKHDTVRANALIDISLEYQGIGDYGKALSIATITEKIAKQCNDYKTLSLLYCNSGNIYRKENDYKKAMDNYLLSLFYANKIDNKKRRAIAYNNMAIVYKAQGNYTKAIHYYLMSAAIKERINDRKGVATSYQNISVVYSHQLNYIKALYYSNQALDIYNSLNNEEGVADMLNNIGTYYNYIAKMDSSAIMADSNYKKALTFYFKSLKIKERLQNDEGLATTYYNIGNLYIDLVNDSLLNYQIHNYEPALSNYNKSLDISRAINDELGMAYCKMGIARILLNTNQSEKSLLFITEALNVFKEMEYTDGIHTCYGLLEDLFKKEKNYKEALKYSQLLTELNQRIFKEESSVQIAEMTAKYETEKKDAEIILLNKNKEFTKLKHEAELKEQVGLRNFFIIGFLLILIIGSIGIYAYNQKLKSTKLIAEKNEEIARQTASLDGQMKERKRIAKELHDGIGGSLAGIKLSMLSALDTHSEINRQLESMANKISDVCLEVRAISHDLAVPVLSSGKLFTDVVNQTISDFRQSNQVTVLYHSHGENRLNAITESIHMVLYRLLQELIHNITKHSKASKAEISLSINDDIIYLIVEDNGIGFDDKKVFKGLGLLNMKTRVQDLNGNIMITTSPGKGTVSNIEIPAVYTSMNNDTV